MKREEAFDKLAKHCHDPSGWDIRFDEDRDGNASIAFKNSSLRLRYIRRLFPMNDWICIQKPFEYELGGESKKALSAMLRKEYQKYANTKNSFLASYMDDPRKWLVINLDHEYFDDIKAYVDEHPAMVTYTLGENLFIEKSDDKHFTFFATKFGNCT